MSRYAPPLNLAKCLQSSNHRRITRARADVMAMLHQERETDSSGSFQNDVTGKTVSVSANEIVEPLRSSQCPTRMLVGTDINPAEMIASRYRLNPKRYRHQLRATISWYQKPQDWTFRVDSQEWRDMIAVAEKMGNET